MRCLKKVLGRSQAHIQLFAERQVTQTSYLRFRHAVAHAEHQCELPCQQWYSEIERNALTIRHPISKAQSCKAGQQRKVFIKGKEGEYGTLPANHCEFQEWTQGRRAEDGETGVTVGKRTQKDGLI